MSVIASQAGLRCRRERTMWELFTVRCAAGNPYTGHLRTCTSGTSLRVQSGASGWKIGARLQSWYHLFDIWESWAWFGEACGRWISQGSTSSETSNNKITLEFEGRLRYGCTFSKEYSLVWYSQKKLDSFYSNRFHAATYSMPSSKFNILDRSCKIVWCMKRGCWRSHRYFLNLGWNRC
jgi:hypothetical protein